MRREAETRNYFTYTEGNTVRKMEAAPAMPDYREERKRREEQERAREQKIRKRNERIAKEKVLRSSRRYVMFLTMAVAVFGVFAVTYINIQSDITARMRKISSLQSQITDLRAENDEAFKRINTAIDLEAVKTRAIEELGMFYATEEQIIYYTVENDNYMNQYVEIPTE